VDPFNVFILFGTIMKLGDRRLAFFEVGKCDAECTAPYLKMELDDGGLPFFGAEQHDAEGTAPYFKMKLDEGGLPLFLRRAA
jgi:hypothetical protein